MVHLGFLNNERIDFFMASQERKKSHHLSRILKRIVEGKSCHEENKTVGRSLWPSASAQDLRFFEMEKEKEDVTSPRGVVEACIRSFDKESSSSDDADNIKNEIVVSQPRSRWVRFFKMWKKSFAKRVPSSLPPLAPNPSTRKTVEDVNLCHFKSSWKVFTISELEAATDNFSQEKVIGQGGYADVYKGCLHDGRLVAIKRLNKGTTEEQIIGFLSEIGTIAHVHHPNTAKLIGYGIEGGTHLVMELSPHGSLGSLLHSGAKKKLDWGARYKIIHGTANGLLYLHENCQRRIIHRDIKADNILLTENFEPQICDFGLATWLPKEWTHHNVSKFEGTFGYFAPEYFMNGIVDEKTDVFAYGVLVLEIITGRQALDDSQKSLVLWAKPLMERNAIRELVDPCLGDDYNDQEMNRVILAASLCIEPTPVLRPRMSQVVMLLRDDYDPKGSTPLQKKRAFQRTYSEELMDAQEYNLTKHLNTVTRIEGS